MKIPQEQILEVIRQEDSYFANPDFDESLEYTISDCLDFLHYNPTIAKAMDKSTLTWNDEFVEYTSLEGIDTLMREQFEGSNFMRRFKIELINLTDICEIIGLIHHDRTDLSTNEGIDAMLTDQIEINEL